MKADKRGPSELVIEVDSVKIIAAYMPLTTTAIGIDTRKTRMRNARCSRQFATLPVLIAHHAG